MNNAGLFGFGRSAEYLIRENFGEAITKEEALKIMKKSEEAGYVHKAFHHGLDPMSEIEGMCQCCKCLTIRIKSKQT